MKPYPLQPQWNARLTFHFRVTITGMEWNVLGHEWASQLLARHIARGEARHAYLFCGPKGVGRRTLALRFAQALNCSNPPQPGQPCGTCRNCTQTERMQHPDLSILQAENEGGTLKIEQVRELQRTLSLAPYQAPRRVALLLRFQEASLGTQNALLKTLEEAPRKVVLLLTADSPESLLPTIVSRCEVMLLRPLSFEKLTHALQTQWQVPAPEARRLAHLAGGRTGTALSLLANPDDVEHIQAWLADLRQLLAAPKRERMAYAEQFSKEKSSEKNREKLRQALQAWLSFWRDVLLRCAGAHAPLTNLDWQAEIEKMAGKLSLDEVRARVRDLERALVRLEVNINPRLQAEVILLDWPRTT